MLDAIKNAIWWCLDLSGAGAGDGGGLQWMMVKFCDEELCWWISNVFSKLSQLKMVTTIL